MVRKPKIGTAILWETRERSPIGKIAEELGIPLVGDCPMGHSSQKGKCFVISPSKGIFKCFHCGVGGTSRPPVRTGYQM